jgi:hypothetical protein
MEIVPATYRNLFVLQPPGRLSQTRRAEAQHRGGLDTARNVEQAFNSDNIIFVRCRIATNSLLISRDRLLPCSDREVDGRKVLRGGCEEAARCSPVVAVPVTVVF